MRVWIKPDQLAKLGLTVPDITRAIQEQNVIAPAGQIGGPPALPNTQFTYTVRTRGRLATAEEFENVIVRSNPDGSQVLVKDVARVELGTQNYNAISRLNEGPAAIVAVYQLPGANGLEVAAAVKAAMAGMSGSFPDGLDYLVSLDTTLAIEAGIREIIVTLFQAVALVILVVFIFLQNVRATLIPALAVPVSLIGTFAVFPLLGFSINTLVAAWPGTGHRHRGRRCDRGGRGGDREDGAGYEAARGDRGGDEGGLRADCRDFAGTDRRVRAGGRDGRHHRPAVSAVRHYDRHFGGPVVDQRAHTQPRAQRHAAAPARRDQRAGCSPSTTGSMPASRTQPPGT